MAADTDSGTIRFALPKGRFHNPTAERLHAAGLGLDDYTARSRHYRVGSSTLPCLSAKILQERDISVHVSVGNYDLGICGADWVRELRARFPAAGLVEIAPLDFTEGAVYLASSMYSDLTTVAAVSAATRVIRVASEYPNLATILASQLRLRRFQVFPIWGAAEAYPPESADLVLVWAKNEQELIAHGLSPLWKMMDVRALLVGNAQAVSGKAMGEVLGRLRSHFGIVAAPHNDATQEGSRRLPPELMRQWQGRSLRLALPDGHQKTPAVELLQRAGIEAAGYAGRTVERRLLGADERLAVKVVRPQDMPLQVACGHFDVAITGQDWLHEHRISFPGSPVTDLVDLGFGKVRIVAALSESIPVNSTAELRRYLLEHNVQSLRVASEYTNIADKYLRENHIRSYRVMPTWGSSEAFLPDDADLLVDNTQTGKTLVENGLKIIEVILRSSACLIANTASLQDPAKRPLIDDLASRLAGAVQ